MDLFQKHCNRMKQEVRVRFKPSLFQHIGMQSSLKGKVQKLKVTYRIWEVLFFECEWGIVFLYQVSIGQQTFLWLYDLYRHHHSQCYQCFLSVDISFFHNNLSPIWRIFMKFQHIDPWHRIMVLDDFGDSKPTCF